MITARPQTSTLTSFILFLIFAYVLLGVNVYVVIVDPMPQWFNYLILVVLVPTVTFVTYKVLFRYKIVHMGDQQIEVRNPQFGRHRKYKLEEVDSWEEVEVKTGNTSSYKELKVKFRDGRIIEMGHREYTDYDRMVSYLSQKLPKARKTQP